MDLSKVRSKMALLTCIVYGQQEATINKLGKADYQNFIGPARYAIPFAAWWPLKVPVDILEYVNTYIYIYIFIYIHSNFIYIYI